MSKLKKSNSNKNLGLKRAILDLLLSSIDKNLFKDVFQPAIKNNTPCKIRCVKCLVSKGRGRIRSPIFTSPRGYCYHLFLAHKTDKNNFPTIEQSLKLCEIYSIMLQLRMVLRDG